MHINEEAGNHFGSRKELKEQPPSPSWVCLSLAGEHRLGVRQELSTSSAAALTSFLPLTWLRLL